MKKNLFKWIAYLAILALILAACGGDETPAPDADPGEDTPAETEEMEEADE